MKKGFFIAFGMLAASISASATTITLNSQTTSVYSASTGPNAFNFGNGGGQADVTLSLSKFDASGLCSGISAPSGSHLTGCTATLTQIDFAISNAISASYSVTNNSGSSAKFTVTASADVAAGQQGGLDELYVGAMPSKQVGLSIANGATKTGTIDTTASGSASFDALGNQISATGYDFVSDPINASAWIGSGSNIIYVIGNFTGSIGGTGFSGSVGGTSTDTVSVQYHYNLEYSYEDDVVPGVPEPTTMTLTGSALLAAGMLVRRFRK
jgi:hypothetical protein